MIQTTLLIKNFVRNEARGLKSSVVMAFWITLLVIGFFLFPNEVLSATLFEDDFETYIVDQDLAGQGEWSQFAGNSEVYKITDEKAKSGIKSVRFSPTIIGTQNIVERFGVGISSGKIGFWVWLDCIEFGTTGDKLRIILRSDSHNSIDFWIMAEDGLCAIDKNFTLWNFVDPLGAYEVEDITGGNWNLIEIEWVWETQKVRFQVNQGLYSVWYDPQNSFDVIERFWLIKENSSGSNGRILFYLDYIAETPTPACELGNCRYCGTYNNCIEADCFWYYSIYQQNYSCVEPFEPEPEDCGSFYSCQYCMTQETCEAEWCEWVDRGFGESCYMEEPTIPPEQVEWEVPELETCEGLGTIETWLCEIKNFVAGAFMPSQEKINSLYQTIGAFKGKFPFNYAESLRIFFSDIEESLDEEKGIPIKILGQESNVSFTFWDQTATIGGVSETFKNVLFDFTSFMVLMGWFVWVVSWIRRFF